ncbi:hypothetical protein ANN_21480 [Periplaneta americana]|uniref:Uncharacterized protein n=1 Tax=Periplaneta americana TaxID=6978 RepID=A0ABQ8SG97_PERAM|nr:hypothetical protein ANN_21480 [Periplaneta americana]
MSTCKRVITMKINFEPAATRPVALDIHNWLVNYIGERVELEDEFHAAIALAFIPYNANNDGQDIKEAFHVLRWNSSHDLESIFQHLEENYVLGRRRGRDRLSPLFPIEVWNYQFVVAGLPRTTNAVEGWHYRLNLLMGKSHPSLTQFLGKLQSEEAEISLQLAPLEIGVTPRKKKRKCADVDRRIERVVDRYYGYKSNGEILQ